jgi:hypothetical protein
MCRPQFKNMVAGTFHVPSAIQKPLVFEATAHGVCLLLFSLRAKVDSGTSAKLLELDCHERRSKT